MNELTDIELIRTRCRFIDIIKSFFAEEPDAERLSRWRGIFTALGMERVNPLMDQAVKELNNLLTEMKLDDIKEEYYELFINPFSDHQATMNMSYYVNGHQFGQSLVKFRGFLMQIDLVKKKEVDESEDSLVFMLDVLATLIEDEKIDPENIRPKETELLSEYLDPFTVHLSRAMQENEKARFYEACIKFLAGYVDLEKGLITP